MSWGRVERPRGPGGLPALFAMGSKDKIAWVAAAISEKEKGNDAAVASALVPRLSLLKDNKVAQDQSKAGDTIQGMNEIAQRCPRVFAVKAVVDECLKLLSWSSGVSAPRDGIVQHQLACSLLMAGHKDLELWPISLVRAYLDDALQGRRWVDTSQASTLVANIITAFPGSHESAMSTSNDKDSKGGLAGKEPDPKRRKTSGGLGVGTSPGATSVVPSADSQGSQPGSKSAGTSFYADEEGEEGEKVSMVRPRFRSAVLQRDIASMVLEVVKRNLDPQPSGDSTQRKLQNLLKVLVLLVVYEQVRFEVMKRLETWVNNPNLVRHLKELMPRLASQCTLATDTEQDTTRIMLRMRPKANAMNMHNEALGILCRSQTVFPLRAIVTLLEIEMKDYEGFAHKSNKSLKNSQYISTILKFSGVPHFTVHRPEELGGSMERINVMDLGLASSIMTCGRELWCSGALSWLLERAPAVLWE